MGRLEEKRKALRELAREQGGFFTTGQAEEIGFARSHHGGFVESGQWVRARRGIFRLASEPEGPLSDLHALGLFFRRRDGGPSGVFGLETAASVQEMGDLLPARIAVLVGPDFRKHAEIPDEVELVRVADLGTEVIRHDGLFVTSPLRTIVDLLAAPGRDAEETRRTFVAARRSGLISKSRLTDLATWAPAGAAERILGWERESVEGGGL